MTNSSATVVFFYALLTAIATGLGAFPLFFAHQVRNRWLGIANGMAAGLMLSASFNLIYEGIKYSLIRVSAGALFGLILIMASRHWLARKKLPGVEALQGAGAMKALMIVGIMTMHSFAEGIGVGVSFGGGRAFGTFISAAIALHNIPEGLAISLILVPQGVSVWKAGLWSVFTSLPQPLMAIPAFIFVGVFLQILPFGFGLAAGAMIYMVFTEIIPGALEETSPNLVASSVTVSIIAMVIFQILLGG